MNSLSRTDWFSNFPTVFEESRSLCHPLAYGRLFDNSSCLYFTVTSVLLRGLGRFKKHHCTLKYNAVTPNLIHLTFNLKLPVERLNFRLLSPWQRSSPTQGDTESRWTQVLFVHLRLNASQVGFGWVYSEYSSFKYWAQRWFYLNMIQKGFFSVFGKTVFHAEYFTIQLLTMQKN